MRKTILKWLLLTALFAYATCITLWANQEARLNVCKSIDVTIAENVSADTITRNGVLTELGKYPKPLIGQSARSINTKALESYLSRFSNFESVDCIVNTEGTLDIRIVPMIPAMRVFDGDNSYYINKDGKRIESKASFFVDVPLVSGTFSEKFTPKMVLPVSRFVENDPDLRKIIAMIHADGPDNIILVPRIHGHVINFGDTTNLPEKKNALLAMYRKVLPYKGWGTYDTISVKFKGQVVASKRNKGIETHGAVLDDDVDPDETTLADLTDEHEE